MLVSTFLIQPIPAEAVVTDQRCAADSCVTISRIMLPEDANPAGIVHGGAIMKEIDNAAGVVAVRHTRKICVTASIDRLDFHKPAFIGNLVTVKASVNMTGKTSMEIGTRVETEDLLSGKKTHLASAYLTFVALGDDHRPTQVPPLNPATPDETRRHREALARREARLAEKTREKECQMDDSKC
ncbi:MAG TPA: acyl-CoA thioesterase [Desulfobacteraceae bacterium]|nr:acyl-CoA thioesterase [Desulfobacteraceae bacterium]|tara:strand:+ start:1627 stop:2178 length:552 start_codon:yes stop_codon:yes gene_type:complete